MFDNRFELYEKVIEFNVVVLKYGSLRSTTASEEDIGKASEAAHESFTGIGYQKAKPLFGDDISDLFKGINDRFAYIITLQDARSSEVSYGLDRYYEYVSKIVDLAQDLPNHFRPYLYFGDYKRNWIGSFVRLAGYNLLQVLILLGFLFAV